MTILLSFFLTEVTSNENFGMFYEVFERNFHGRSHVSIQRKTERGIDNYK